VSLLSSKPDENGSDIDQRKGKAPATVNTYLAGIKGVCKEAWFLHQLNVEDYQQIKEVKGDSGSRLPKDVHFALRKFGFCCKPAMKMKRLGLRDGAMLAILAGCGLRRAEIVNLDVASLVRKDRTLKVIGKGNKERIAFIPAGAWTRLTAWLDAADLQDGPMFTRIRRHGAMTSERMTSQSVYHILHERSLQAGIENVAPHDLRRTYATTLLKRGSTSSRSKTTLATPALQRHSVTLRGLMSADARPVKSSITFEAAPNFVAPSGCFFLACTSCKKSCCDFLS
jgi:site-specific recombinase XerD